MGDNNEGMFSFLASFNFDCLFFFDEFEKQFGEHDSSVLQFMDGIYTSEYRRIFLLTTNNLTVNENLLSRPSRIRYVRQFGNLDKKVVDEYLEDNLHDKTNKTLLIDYIDTLTISTIDILKAIVEEANIHGVEEFIKMKNSFNVTTASYHYRNMYSSITISKVKRVKYSIEQAVKEIKIYEDRFNIKDTQAKELLKAKTQEEIDKINKEYTELLNTEGNIYYGNEITSDKPWTKLVPNKDRFDDDLVLAVDLEHHIVVVDDGDGYLRYILIKNPDEKPSLYQERKFDYNSLFY